VIARWTVRPRLMGVSGVANVSIWACVINSSRCRLIQRPYVTTR
jgi:hypothetical protein